MDWNRTSDDTKEARRVLARRRLVVLEYVPRNGDVVVIDKSPIVRAPSAFRGRRHLAVAR